MYETSVINIIIIYQIKLNTIIKADFKQGLIFSNKINNII